MKMNLFGEVAKTLVPNLRTHHDIHATQAEYQARFPCHQALPPMVIAVFSPWRQLGVSTALGYGFAYHIFCTRNTLESGGQGWQMRRLDDGVSRAYEKQALLQLS